MTYITYEETLATQEVVCLKKVLIDWIFEVGEKFQQSNLIIHIAIAYLERAYQLGLQKAPASSLDSHLRTLALTCLLLAAKYDELDDKIPFINDMARVVKSIVSVKQQDVLKLETKILFAFGWDLMIITPLHFVYSVAAQGFIFEATDSVMPKQLRNQKGLRDSNN